VLASEGGSGHAEPFVNDLQGPVAAHHPEIARVVHKLQREGALHAAMSGSGSAVFGLFDRRVEAVRAAAALSSVSRVCHTVVTRTVNRSKYQRLAAS
jgi:4-diphosphocytidyl-2C-methyl-D-erythritol kinase